MSRLQQVVLVTFQHHWDETINNFVHIKFNTSITCIKHEHTKMQKLIMFYQKLMMLAMTGSLQYAANLHGVR